MRLAIVHYHLQRGGVTRVIATALEALGPSIEKAVVLSSTEPAEPLPWPVAVIPELAYTDRASPALALRISKAMQAAAREHLGGIPDLWHVHNHSLGKNASFPEALKQLADQGTPLLLQIHDFAEDGRPGNYRRQRDPYEKGILENPETAFYPVAPQIGYAVLNGRDRDILRAAGIPASNLFWLPNAVTTPPLESGGPTARTGDRPLVLYPTRGIRRKNIGELLLQAMASPDHRYATTLAPENPQWKAVHAQWAELASRLGLAVRLGLAQASGIRFEELVREADSMITTSVAEGFGLAFLEPWLFGKPVTGRDLPDITRDFKDNGISFPGLYREWPVALSLIDASGLQNRFKTTARQVYADYGLPLPQGDLDEAWERLTADGRIDFARLDEIAQMQCLEALHQSREICLPETSPEPVATPAGTVETNARRIRQIYGLAPYREKLLSAYKALLEAAAGEPQGVPPDRVLGQFLDLDRLYLLRT